MEFKGTKGVFEVLEYINDLEVGKLDGTLICTLPTKTDEYLANANLMCDALNTIQKCNLLPSELLEQRNEILEILERVLKIYGRGYEPKENVEDTVGSILYKELQQLIQKATTL